MEKADSWADTLYVMFSFFCVFFCLWLHLMGRACASFYGVHAHTHIHTHIHTHRHLLLLPRTKRKKTHGIPSCRCHTISWLSATKLQLVLGKPSCPSPAAVFGFLPNCQDSLICGSVQMSHSDESATWRCTKTLHKTYKAEVTRRARHPPKQVRPLMWHFQQDFNLHRHIHHPYTWWWKKTSRSDTQSWYSYNYPDWHNMDK